MKLSPMMQKYMDTKAEYDDCILFFRLGDFYEMFFDDAKLVSKELELTLTSKSCGLKEKAPMCGVPYHASDSYISKLVDKGYKVAICEQLEDPANAKGMVKRGVVKVVTPGTVTSSVMLKENENNYLASACLLKGSIALSYTDLSTGELRSTEFSGSESFDDLINELAKINAREILINDELDESHGEGEIASLTNAFVKTMSGSYFAERPAKNAIKDHFGHISLTALGFEGRNNAIIATGALLLYLRDTQKSDVRQIRNADFYDPGNHMSLDKATIRNLELTETLFDKRHDGSLLWVLDRTGTAMGGRELKKWIKEPLNSTYEINSRLDAVTYFVENELMANDVREALKNVYDFERLTGKMAEQTANGRDMLALSRSIAEIPEIKACIKDSGSELLEKLNEDIADLFDIKELIDSAITDEPPVTITDGELIKEGYSEELDDLKSSIKDSKSWIASLESKEKERTGITHLKVGYNQVFGYYIEVSRSNLDLVPEDYIRKQTLVGAERFVTPKLKEVESVVLSAETKINELEYSIFRDLREIVNSRIDEIQRTSKAISCIDVLVSLARVALDEGYIRPEVNDGHDIEIEKGRHPVIEKADKTGSFVPNDVYMNDRDSSMLVITGPNMAGKSTYMRQTALIVLMAQMGSYVPAQKAKIGVTDRIFTRIGASDDLTRGQSTFFMEMSELSYILRNATKKSLIILDEIGRGTSTYDGLSIAWATIRKLCSGEGRIRTLFATHYHELTDLENELGGVRNLNCEVTEHNGEVVFLHSIVPGPASKSYGIHVARLAGVPRDLLDDADRKLSELENKENVLRSDGKAIEKSNNSNDQNEQISFFDKNENPAIDKLKQLDLMETKPSEAFEILEELKSLAANEDEK